MPINFLFDVLAPVYDRVIGDRDPEEMVEVLELSKDMSLLDVGGGTGRVSSQWKNYVSNLFLADLSSSMLVEAQKKDVFDLTNTSSERLPFKRNSFDRIMVIDALHHFPNQKYVVKELFRIAKPGGIILIEEPDINKLLVKGIAIAEKLALMGSHIHSPLEIQEMMNQYSKNTKIIHDGRISAWIVARK